MGTHWPLSRAFNDRERARIQRTGLCMRCHREMTNEELWSAISAPGRLTMNEHIELMNQLLKGAAENRVKRPHPDGNR